MELLTGLIIRGVLVVAINDAIIFYVMNKRSQKITLPIAIGIILVTCIALVINIWYSLHRNGIV
jgi:Na+-translocating ferredoxin:NAD+ oxidoreductase RnfE subunit